jgi:glycosyltransferase involved in cell wall biosynthesis
MRIFVGPAQRPQTGQSKMFWLAADVARQGDIVVTLTTEGRLAEKLVRFLPGILGFTAAVLRNRRSLVYFCAARSLMGVLKDAIVVGLAKLTGATIVNHLHGSDFRAFYEGCGRLGRALVRSVYRGVDCSIVLHESMRDQYAGFDTMHVALIGNCVDDAFRLGVREGARKIFTADTPLKVLFLGNILPDKGFLDLIEGVETAIRGGARVELMIAGQETAGTFAEALRGRFGENYALPDGIRFCGPLFGAAKIAAFREAHLFALPSHYASEAVPLAALEAMVSGCALLLSTWRYLPQVFAEAGAVFVEPRAPSAIAAQLIRLDSDRKALAALGDHNFDHAEKRYSEHTFKAELAALLATLEKRGAGERRDGGTEL